MPVIKGTYSEQYTVIPNGTLRDKSISFEARGVLALMLSMPADWEMYKSWLVDQCPATGKDKMTRILKELEQAKYLIRIQQRNNGGKFDSYVWYVYPVPTENGLAADGLAGAGKSAPTKERIKQSKENTNTSSTDDQPVKYPKPLDETLLSQITDHWQTKMPMMPRVDLTKNTQINKKRWRAICKILKDHPEYLDHEYWLGHFGQLATLPELEWQRQKRQLTFDQAVQLDKFERNLGYMRSAQ